MSWRTFERALTIIMFILSALLIVLVMVLQDKSELRLKNYEQCVQQMNDFIERRGK